MRVTIDESGLDEDAARWWRTIPPWKRAHFVQCLWECNNGENDGFPGPGYEQETGPEESEPANA